MNIRHFSHIPKPYLAYVKVLQGLVFKKAKIEQVLPDVCYVVDEFKVDQQHLKAYNDICGFKHNGYIPAIYLAVLSQRLQMQMMTQEAFPFALLGLVHIRNQIQQNRKVGSNEKLSLSCQFGELKPHDKGLQFDFITTVKVGDEIVVEGVTTYLSRQKTAEKAKEKTAEVEQIDYQLQDIWQIQENIGRRYAKISGDLNLIHLHAISAKAFGFKQAIAHGMWSKARALASLNLPDAYAADVWFKLPLYLPSEVEFLKAEQAELTQFLIQNHKDKKPHVSGSVQALKPVR